MKIVACHEKGEAAGEKSLTLTKKMWLRLRINTAAGPVNVPGLVEVFLLQGQKEYLISDATLKRIGIDIDQMIEQLAYRTHLNDGDDVGHADNVDDDASELERPNTPIRVAQTTIEGEDREIQRALLVLIDDAIDHGLPEEH